MGEKKQGNMFWFLMGVRGILDPAVLMLTLGLVGFSALAHDAGISLWQSVFMQVTIWALPSMLLVVDGISQNTPITIIMLSVALAAIRFMPMVMAILPQMRNPKTPNWILMIVCHFMAITAWVYALSKFDQVPRKNRLAFFFGFSVILCFFSTLIMAFAYKISSSFSPLLLAGLAFIIPIYFSITLWQSARIGVDRLALIIGAIITPIVYFILPEFDLILGGIIGGSLAFFMRKSVRNWVR